MLNFRKSFTEWYFDKGYDFLYRENSLEPKWICPWYVKPLLIFFSPSVYLNRCYKDYFVDGFEGSLKGETENV